MGFLDKISQLLELKVLMTRLFDAELQDKAEKERLYKEYETDFEPFLHDPDLAGIIGELSAISGLDVGSEELLDMAQLVKEGKIDWSEIEYLLKGGKTP